MPRWIQVLWFWSFNVFVLLVLLNMLLAITLDFYTRVSSELNSQSDAIAVWTQAKRYIQRLKTTREFVYSFARLLLLLEGEGNEAHHPQLLMTEESLLEAFEGMTEEQAEWLIAWLHGETLKEEQTLQDSQLTALVKELGNLFDSAVMGYRANAVQVAMWVKAMRRKYGHRVALESETPADTAGLTASEEERRRQQELQEEEEDRKLLEQLDAQRQAITEMSLVVTNLAKRAMEFTPEPSAQAAATKASVNADIGRLAREVADLKNELDALPVIVS